MIRDGAIEHEMLLPYPPERVWQALVDPGELGVWLMPNDFEGWHDKLSKDLPRLLAGRHL